MQRGDEEDRGECRARERTGSKGRDPFNFPYIDYAIIGQS